MKYKIVFPTGCLVNDVSDDNLDINVVRSDAKVFFGTLFTLANIQRLMKDNYFWAVDMIIVSDLKIDTIRHVVRQVIEDGHLELAFDFIGSIEAVYGMNQGFDDLKPNPISVTIDL